MPTLCSLVEVMRICTYPKEPEKLGLNLKVSFNCYSSVNELFTFTFMTDPWVTCGVGLFIVMVVLIYSARTPRYHIYHGWISLRYHIMRASLFPQASAWLAYHFLPCYSYNDNYRATFILSLSFSKCLKWSRFLFLGAHHVLPVRPGFSR